MDKEGTPKTVVSVIFMTLGDNLAIVSGDDDEKILDDTTGVILRNLFRFRTPTKLTAFAGLWSKRMQNDEERMILGCATLDPVMSSEWADERIHRFLKTYANLSLDIDGKIQMAVVVSDGAGDEYTEITQEKRN